ncbi:MAG: apolipoprotein N-acyltransferase [Flavobacteriales bacterium]|jgi:apolipoprotein N-acyltransferase|nr:apolipoprotein N-acyltransferase [Flavobacteriales bacterium]
MAPSSLRILSLAVLSGLLWCLAWPAVGGITALAFVAWVPLLWAEELRGRSDGERRVRFVPYVLAATFVWNLGCTWWFVMVSEPWSTRLVSVGAPVLVNTFLMALPWWLRRVAHRRLGARWADAALVLAWIAFERLHHGWDLQWPWLSMGNVLGTRPQWAQWYDHTGMLGGTLWTWLVNLLLFRAMRAWRLGRPWKRSMALAGTVLCVPMMISLARFHRHVEQGPPMDVVVVQPNIDPYSEKFHAEPMAQLERMLELAGTAMDTAVRLVLLPETALQEHSTVDPHAHPPLFVGLWENDLDGSRSARRIADFVRAHGRTAVLAGMSSYHLLPDDAALPPYARALPGTDRHYSAANAAMFTGTDGRSSAYRKSKLVAGVEQLPFAALLGHIEQLSVDLGGTTGSLAKQAERTVFRDPAAGIAVAPVICYESVFGEHVAAHVRNGAELIAVITNDGWWADSPGYRQHLTFSSLRAIETRRAVARSANTGISCAVDQRGVVHDATDWWVPDARRVTVHRNTAITPFVRHGDIIGRAAVAATIVLLLMLLLPARWRRRPGPRSE